MVDPGLFAALRTGYGALGIVTSLDLAVVPLWRMEEVGVEEWQERGGDPSPLLSLWMQVVAPVQSFRAIFNNLTSLIDQ